MFLYSDTDYSSLNKVHSCDINNGNIFQVSRKCKSEYIASHEDFKSADIKAKIDKINNKIILFIQKQKHFNGFVSYAYGKKDSYYYLALGYGNFFAEYNKGKTSTLYMESLSLNYGFTYSASFFDTTFSIGAGAIQYTVDIQDESIFLSSKITISKNILGAKIGVLANIQQDIINNATVVAIGGSVGF